MRIWTMSMSKFAYFWLVLMLNYEKYVKFTRSSEFDIQILIVLERINENY